MRKNYKTIDIIRVIAYDLVSIVYCGCAKQPAEDGAGYETREPLWRRSEGTMLSKIQSGGKYGKESRIVTRPNTTAGWHFWLGAKALGSVT